MKPTPIENLRTPRLQLARMRAGDLDDLLRMYADPRVMATLGGVRSDAGTRALLQKQIDHWDQHGFGRWVAREPSTGRFIGRGGLQRIVMAGLAEVEVGYGLMPEFWGQGLATELAAESVRVAFEELGLAELVCFTLPSNLASRRVMEKVGFRFESDVIWADLPHVLCRLTAADWRDREGEAPAEP